MSEYYIGKDIAVRPKENNMSYKHPFFPIGLRLIGYKDMTIPAIYIFAVFGAAVLSLIGGVWALSGVFCVMVGRRVARVL